MQKQVYDKRSWRNLPRDFCAIEWLFGQVAGSCGGLIHLHHVDDQDPDSRSVPVCQVHHPTLQAALRRLRRPEKAWKRCTHHHPYPGGKEACEAKLNGIENLNLTPA